MNTELSGLVITGGDYTAAIRFAANGYRQMKQRRIIAHLHCGIETITVAVDYFPQWRTLSCAPEKGTE